MSDTIVLGLNVTRSGKAVRRNMLNSHIPVALSNDNPVNHSIATLEYGEEVETSANLSLLVISASASVDIIMKDGTGVDLEPVKITGLFAITGPTNGVKVRNSYHDTPVKLSFIVN